jgi:hypothetical protein
MRNPSLGPSWLLRGSNLFSFPSRARLSGRWGDGSSALEMVLWRLGGVRKWLFGGTLSSEYTVFLRHGKSARTSAILNGEKPLIVRGK